MHFVIEKSRLDDDLFMDCEEFERIISEHGNDVSLRKFALKLGCSLASETEQQVQRSFAQTGRLLPLPPSKSSAPSVPRSSGREVLNLSRKCSRIRDPENLPAGTSSWYKPQQTDTERREWVSETTPLPSARESRERSRSNSGDSRGFRDSQSADGRSRSGYSRSSSRDSRR